MLFLGRFDPSKRPDLLVRALSMVAKRGLAFTASFVGGVSNEHSLYPQEVADLARDLGIADRIEFVGAVPNTDTYKYYRSHTIYVNSSKSGMLDKSLFKSIACGCLPIFTSADLGEMIGTEYMFTDGDVDDLATHLAKALSLTDAERERQVKEFQVGAVEAHTIPVLVTKLLDAMTP